MLTPLLHTFFDEIMTTPNMISSSRSVPFEVDLSEDQDGFTIVGDLPGVTKNDVTVAPANDQTVVITATREAETSTMLHRERSTGSVSRAIRLPPTADLSSIVTNLCDGVLMVRIMKKGRSSWSRLSRKLGGAVRWVLSVLPFALYALTVYFILTIAPTVLVQFAPAIDFVLSLLLSTIIFNFLFSLLLSPWSTPVLSPTTLLLPPGTAYLFPPPSHHLRSYPFYRAYW